MNIATEPAPKSKRNPWPVAIVAYFVVFIAFTVGIVGYVSHQKMDLVRGDYYDDEIRYQEQLDRMNRTADMQGKVAIGYDKATEAITISLQPSEGQTQIAGRIRLYRPSDETMDQDIQLALDSAGRQSLDARNLKTGLWKVRVYWTVAGRDYYFNQSVVVGPKNT